MDEPDRNSPAVFVVGALPPPVNGMANVNSQMVQALEQCVQTVSENTSLRRGRSIAYYSASRIYRLIRSVMRLYHLHFQRNIRAFYTSANDGYGLVITILSVMAARSLKLNIYIHHHSYKYILNHSYLMKLLTHLGGPTARHIFLCDCMQNEFKKKYHAEFSVIIQENYVDVGLPAIVARRKDEPIALGHLANLTFEKGLREVVEIWKAINSELTASTLHLAGPSVNNEVDLYISNNVKKSGLPHTIYGPVYGPQKDRFFAEIDVFVFPTNYPAETLPLVLIEAACNGVVVITTKRGCIGSLSSYEGVFLVETAEEMKATLLQMCNPELHGSIFSTEARRHRASLNVQVNSKARQKFYKLAEAIAYG